jgi:hypothetical protein
LKTGHLSDALGLMRKGTNEEISDGLEIDIGPIMEIGNLCKKKVKEVIDKYDIVIKELNELTQATLLKKGVTEEARRTTLANIKADETEKNFLEEQLKKQELELEKTKKQFEEETNTFKIAVEDLGSTKSFGKQFANAVLDTAASVVPILAMSGGISMIASAATTAESIVEVAGMVGGQAVNAFKQIKSDSNSHEAEKVPLGSEAESLVGRARELALIIKDLQEKAFESDTKLRVLDLKDKQPLVDAQKSLDRQMSKINEAENTEMREKLLKVCKMIDKLIKDIHDACDKNDDNVINLHQDSEKIHAKCIKYGDARSKAQLFGCPAPSVVGNLKQNLLGGISKSNLSQAYAQEVQMKMELTKEQLRNTEKEAEKQRERQLKVTKELHQALANLTRFKEEKATQDEVLQQIVQGLQYFGKLKKQWMELQQFFDAMSNLVSMFKTHFSCL